MALRHGEWYPRGRAQKSVEQSRGADHASDREPRSEPRTADLRGDFGKITFLPRSPIGIDADRHREQINGRYRHYGKNHRARIGSVRIGNLRGAATRVIPTGGIPKQDATKQRPVDHVRALEPVRYLHLRRAQGNHDSEGREYDE